MAGGTQCESSIKKIRGRLSSRVRRCLEGRRGFGEVRCSTNLQHINESRSLARVEGVEDGSFPGQPAN